MGDPIQLGQLTDALNSTFMARMQEYCTAHCPAAQPEVQLDPSDTAGAQQTEMADPSSNPATGIVGTIDDFRVPVLNVRLPWASAVLGISGGTIVGNVIDAAMPPKNVAGQNNLINPVLQVVAAGMEARFFPGYLGKFAAGAHIVKLALRYTPLAQWLGQVEQMLSQPLAQATKAVGVGQDAFQNTAAYQVDHNYQTAPGFAAASPAWN